MRKIYNEYKSHIKGFYKEYESYFKGVLTAMCIIGIYDFLIAPGLTARNTLVNIISFWGGSMLLIISAILIWTNLFKNDKKEETNESEKL